MKQPSRIDWGSMIIFTVIVIPFVVALVLAGYGLTTIGEKRIPPPPPQTAELEISVEDLERISTMFAGEAKKIRDERMDSLEERISKLEEKE